MLRGSSSSLYSQYTRSSGFTLLELLVSMGIIGLLAATSVQSFNVLRLAAYNSAIDRTMHDARVAVEAGRINFQEGTNQWFGAWSMDGALQGWGPNGETVQQVVPGLRVTKDLRVNINYNTWCNDGNVAGWCDGGPCCIAESFNVRHCKSGVSRSLHVWNNGDVTEWEWRGMIWGC